MKPTRVLGPLAAATVIAVGVFALQRTYTTPRGAYGTNTSHQLSWYDATYFCCTSFTRHPGVFSLTYPRGTGPV